MIETVKISSRGQIVIPERFRKEFKIKEGDKLIVREENGKMVMESEESFSKKIKGLELNKDKIGWLYLAEKGLAFWDNKKDDEEWSKYL